MEMKFVNPPEIINLSDSSEDETPVAATIPKQQDVTPVPVQDKSISSEDFSDPCVFFNHEETIFVDFVLKIIVPYSFWNYYKLKEEMTKKRKDDDDDCTMVGNISSHSALPLKSGETSETEGENLTTCSTMQLFMRILTLITIVYLPHVAQPIL